MSDESRTPADPVRPLTYVSLGAGTQSSALLVMALTRLYSPSRRQIEVYRQRRAARHVQAHVVGQEGSLRTDD